MTTTRRTWMKNSVAACASALGATQSLGAAPAHRPSRVVDCHTHFYDPTRPGGVPWPGKGTPLHRTVLPEHWLALAAPHGARETVVVEASPLLEDNQWILDLAAREKSIVGFVGNLDLADPQCSSHLARFAKNKIFRGIRARGGLSQLETARDVILQSAKTLAEHGLELDLNGAPASLQQIGAVLREVPDLTVVINHLGAPGDPKNLKPDWKDTIRKVSAEKNVFMKVSALVEQVKGPAGEAPREVDYYLPILDHLWDCFGPDRLIYGSNWPVSDRGAPYDVVFGIVHEYFSSKGSEACEKYFWQNSVTAYRWTART